MAAPVVHFEIHGKDGKQLQDFYSKLFSWKVNANNPMEYGMVQDSGIGGGITGPDGPMVTVYVEVPDLQATLQKAESLGGKTVMPPMEVPGGPTIAQFKDPAGNTIGLTKAGSM
jgi:predicted enzyme related to lactoylglutathione lyase